MAEETPTPPDEYMKGRVESVMGPLETDYPFPTESILQIRVTVEGLPAPVEAEYAENPLSSFDDLQPGDRVVIVKTSAFAGEPRYIIQDFYRLPSLFLLTLLFVFLAVCIARWRAVTALAGLFCSLLILVYFTVPSIANGASPFLVATVSAFVIATVSITVAHGFSRQTLVALASTLLTLAAAVGFSVLAVSLSRMLGYGSEDAFSLQFSSTTFQNLRGLLLAGMIIGTLGVLDDVTTTQTAAIKEFADGGRETRSSLIRKGIAVGKEHVASLINTLALAYVGASLPLILLFSLNSDMMPKWAILNSEVISEEIVRTLVGSGALVLAVPLSTLLAAIYYSRRSRASV